EDVARHQKPVDLKLSGRSRRNSNGAERLVQLGSQDTRQPELAQSGTGSQITPKPVSPAPASADSACHRPATETSRSSQYSKGTAGRRQAAIPALWNRFFRLWVGRPGNRISSPPCR